MHSFTRHERLSHCLYEQVLILRVEQYIAMVNRKLENEEIGRFDARQFVADEKGV